MSHLRMSAADYNARMTKKPKYGNKKKMVNGLTFDSTREATRYQDLALMQHAKHIKELRRQVRFPIYMGKIFICEWVADFTYATADECKIVEDSKGFKTDVYKLKKKLVEAQYGIKIKES